MEYEGERQTPLFLHPFTPSREVSSFWIVLLYSLAITVGLSQVLKGSHMQREMSAPRTSRTIELHREASVYHHHLLHLDDATFPARPLHGASQIGVGPPQSIPSGRLLDSARLISLESRRCQTNLVTELDAFGPLIFSETGRAPADLLT